MNQFRLNEINLFDVIEWFEIQKSKSIETHLSFHFYLSIQLYPGFDWPVAWFEFLKILKILEFH